MTVNVGVLVKVGVAVGVNVGVLVLVGVAVGVGQLPNVDIAPSVPTWNTSPDALLNQLLPPLYKLAGIKTALVYNARPKEDA